MVVGVRLLHELSIGSVYIVGLLESRLHLLTPLPQWDSATLFRRPRHL